MSKSDFFIIPNSPVLKFSPELAQEIGLRDSIVLLHIDEAAAESTKVYAGKKYINQSVRDIQARFPFMGLTTINRAINSLLKQQLIIQIGSRHNSCNKTRTLAINAEVCVKLKSFPA